MKSSLFPHLQPLILAYIWVLCHSPFWLRLCENSFVKLRHLFFGLFCFYLKRFNLLLKTCTYCLKNVWGAFSPLILFINARFSAGKSVSDRCNWSSTSWKSSSRNVSGCTHSFTGLTWQSGSNSICAWKGMIKFLSSTPTPSQRLKMLEA